MTKEKIEIQENIPEEEDYEADTQKTSTKEKTQKSNIAIEEKQETKKEAKTDEPQYQKDKKIDTKRKYEKSTEQDTREKAVLLYTEYGTKDYGTEEVK